MARKRKNHTTSGNIPKTVVSPPRQSIRPPPRIVSVISTQPFPKGKEKLLLMATCPNVEGGWIIDKNAIRGGIIYETDCFKDLGHVKSLVTSEYLRAIHSDMKYDNPDVSLAATSPDKIEVTIYKLEPIGRIAINNDLSISLQLNKAKSIQPDESKSNQTGNQDIKSTSQECQQEQQTNQQESQQAGAQDCREDLAQSTCQSAC